MERDLTDLLFDLCSRLRDARRITVLSGAGISAASGVPTFRGKDGLWRNVRAENLATPEAFHRDPKLVWEWYDWRRSLIARCEPNAAHLALARLEQRQPLTLITQNVDGLHERAGSRRVIRFHGSIWQMRCAASCQQGRVPWDDLSVPLPQIPSRCPYCSGYARPSVVWFGESIDERVLGQATAALDCDVFLSVGTSSVVYPAAGLIHSARRAGAYAVEINPHPTEMAPDLDLVLPGRAEEILPRIVE